MKESILQQILSTTKLSTTQVEGLVKIGLQKQIAKKELLTSPLQMVDKAYFLKSGVVRHFVKNDSQEFTKNFIKGPRFMLPSLTNYFMETPSVLYCEALSPLDVIEWKRKDLYEYADTHPKLYKFFIRSVVRAFQNKEVKEIALNNLDAQQRYLSFLHEFPDLINEIPGHYIASYLGIRPETLSRIRAKRIS